MYDHLLRDVLPAETGRVYLQQFINDYVESEQLLLSYEPRMYRGRVVLFCGTDDAKSSADVHLGNRPSDDPPRRNDDAETRGWSQFTEDGYLEVVFTPGNHDNLLLPPHVTSTATLLKQALNKHGFGLPTAIDRSTVPENSGVARGEGSDSGDGDVSSSVWKLNK